MTTALFLIAFARWANLRVLKVSLLQLHYRKELRALDIMKINRVESKNRTEMWGCESTFGMEKRHRSLQALRSRREIPVAKMSTWNLYRVCAYACPFEKLLQECLLSSCKFQKVVGSIAYTKHSS